MSASLAHLEACFPPVAGRRQSHPGEADSRPGAGSRVRYRPWATPPDPEQVLYVRITASRASLKLTSGESVIAGRRFASLAELLPPPAFMRVSRSHLINRRHLKLVRPAGADYELVLTDGTVIASEPTYRQQIRDRFFLSPGHAREFYAGGYDTTAGNSQLLPVAGTGGQDAAGWQLRPCRRGDAAALATLGQATFMETYAGLFADGDILAYCAEHNTSGFFQAWLEDPETRLWLLETAGGTPIGYLVLAPARLPAVDPHHSDLEIQRFYLLNHFDDGSLRRQLLQQAIQAARQSGCSRLLMGEYAAATQRSAFYEHAGFRRIGAFPFRAGGRDYDDIVFGLEL